MRKTYVRYAEDGASLELCRYDGTERFALYVGIDHLVGGWLLETGGNADTLEELESCGAEYIISAVSAIIEAPDVPWEECDESDDEYVADWLSAWGIDA